jgi:hypothetical protein
MDIVHAAIRAIPSHVCVVNIDIELVRRLATLARHLTANGPLGCFKLTVCYVFSFHSSFCSGALITPQYRLIRGDTSEGLSEHLARKFSLVAAPMDAQVATRFEGFNGANGSAALPVE